MQTKSWFSQGILWLGPYLILILAPTGLVLLTTPHPARGFWIEFGVGLGFAGLVGLCLQFVLTARFSRVAAIYGQDAMLQFHRQMGIVAAIFILIHHTLLLVVEPAFLEFLDPRAGLPRAMALTFVLIALGLLIIPSLWRQRLGIPYEWWRLGHGLLSFAVVVIGIVHTLQVGHYTAEWWKQAFWVGLAALTLLLILYVRVVRPLIMLRQPYRVAEVRRERGNSWTLTLEPEGHAGMKFRAGQYAWLTLGHSPFSLQQHPFSFSSSASSPHRLEFTIKELGDFTRTVGQVPPGSRAYLEGPFGTFNIDLETSGETVFIVGGIGITPIMSMLRTLRDRGDRRPLVFIYAVNHLADALFREELEELKQHLNLCLIYVIAYPEEGWEGERGFITDEMLKRHLPSPEHGACEYFICGPGPMMTIVERALVTQGVPLHNIHAERFDIGAAAETGIRQKQLRNLAIGLGLAMAGIVALFALLRHL